MRDYGKGAKKMADGGYTGDSSLMEELGGSSPASAPSYDEDRSGDKDIQPASVASDSKPAQKRTQTKSAAPARQPYSDARQDATGKKSMFSDSRAKTKAFDAGVKAAAARNREDAAELSRESRRGNPPPARAPQINVAAIDSKTLLPKAMANGGQVGRKTYGKSGC